MGAYNDLMNTNGDFSNLIKTHVKESNHKSEEESAPAATSATSATDKKPATKVPPHFPTILNFSGIFLRRKNHLN
jgi:hypothetical protein